METPVINVKYMFVYRKHINDDRLLCQIAQHSLLLALDCAI